MNELNLEGRLTAYPLSKREAVFQMVPAVGYFRAMYATLKGKPTIFNHHPVDYNIEPAFEAYFGRLAGVTGWAAYQIATSAAIGYGLVKLVERLGS